MFCQAVWAELPFVYGKGADGPPDTTALIVNPYLTLTGISLEAYAYVVNGRSALEWVMDRYHSVLRYAIFPERP